MPDTPESHARTGRPTAFLSYARADRALAGQLATALEQAGISVWWDTLIEGGAEFAKSIEAALDRSDAVVVAWSVLSVGSDWVLDEASRGREMHKLVPVSLDGTEPPMGFRRYQSVDLRAWFSGDDGRAIDRVVRGIETIARRTPGETLPTTTGARGHPSSPSRRRLLIAAGGSAVAAATAWALWRTDRLPGLPAARSKGNSVAVLPFANLSGDEGQDYFADGLAEEVRATLARDLRLLVMAQASAAQFRKSEAPATDIAEQLGVAYLLSGSVRRSGDVVRVAADLVDGSTGFSRWSQTFERRIDDIFAVQTEIAKTVADALVARVEADDRPSADDATPLGGTTDLAAYDAYLRGRALYDLSADEASERAALAQFDAALAADPAYAAAHAARARSLTTIANQYGDVESRSRLYEEAVTAARRAIELAPGLADGYSTLGATLFQGLLDARAAREPFERSAELGAGEATVMARYALYGARSGNDAAAVPAIKRALVLDPLNPLIHRAAGAVEYAARRYEASIPPMRQALAMNPKMSRTHAAIGDALLMLGRIEEARADYTAEPQADFRLAGLAIVERRLGNEAAASAALEQLVAERGDQALYQQAQVHAQWGARDRALERLEEARRIGDSGLIYARNDPLLDPLRDDPRFAALLESLGFA